MGKLNLPLECICPQTIPLIPSVPFFPATILIPSTVGRSISLGFESRDFAVLLLNAFTTHSLVQTGRSLSINRKGPDLNNLLMAW